MFDIFLKNISGELAKSQFGFVCSAKNAAQEEKVVIFARDESPLFYLVSVADFDNFDPFKFENAVTDIQNDILKDNGRIFNNVVSVNIMYTENVEKAEEFVRSRESLRDGGTHNIWWYTDGKNLYFPKGQPNKIYGIEKIAKRALSAENDFENMDVAEISHTESKKARLQTKAKFPVVIILMFVLNIIIFAVQNISDSDFVLRFGINHELIFEYGQWYRLFTYMFIHGGLEHIACNCIALYIYGTRVEKYCGNFKTLIIYIVSGLAGGLLSALFNTGFAVGASGAIFGLMAAVLVISKKSGQKIDGLGYMTLIIIAIMGIGMGMLDAGVDNFGHIGGFVGGLVISALVYGSKKSK